MTRTTLLSLGCLLSLSLVACGDDDSGGTDTGAPDTNVMDTNPALDTAPGDTNVPDTNPADTGSMGCEGDGCDVVGLAGGSSHTCAIRGNGEVLCWGQNFFGQLGDGLMRHPGTNCTDGEVEQIDCFATPVVAQDLEATAISANAGPSTCALTSDGVSCWGLSNVPPVGSDQRTRVRTPEVLDGFSGATVLARNSINTCALVGTDVLCRGESENGQLGTGERELRRDPAAVTGLTAPTSVAISSGGSFACATDDGSVKCWGSDRSGELGDGDAAHGTPCGDALTEIDCSDVPVEVVGLDGTEQIHLGSNFACALTTAGTVMCWGSNNAAQLGMDPSAVGQLNVPTDIGLSGIVDLAVGRNHVCTIDTAGAVACHGGNEEGQLGDGMEVGSHGMCTLDTTIDCSSTPVSVTLPAPAIEITAGFEHTCVLLDNADVYCWGLSEDKQLGTDVRERQPSPVLVEFN